MWRGRKNFIRRAGQEIAQSSARESMWPWRGVVMHASMNIQRASGCGASFVISATGGSAHRVGGYTTARFRGSHLILCSSRRGSSVQSDSWIVDWRITIPILQGAPGAT